MAAKNTERWTPNVTVAAIVEANGRYLLVEEATADGLRLNNPAGHLEAGESLVQAVVREVLEETACAFTPSYLVGVYLAPASDPRTPSYLRFTFAGSVGAPQEGRSLDRGIVRTLWLTPPEIGAERARHRSALLWRGIQDHRAGQRHSLALLHFEALRSE